MERRQIWTQKFLSVSIDESPMSLNSLRVLCHIIGSSVQISFFEQKEYNLDYTCNSSNKKARVVRIKNNKYKMKLVSAT